MTSRDALETETDAGQPQQPAANKPVRMVGRPPMVRALTNDGDEIDTIARDFEGRVLTPDELAEIKRTRRRSPRLEETRAEMYAFRDPQSCESRIKPRPASDDTKTWHTPPNRASCETCTCRVLWLTLAALTMLTSVALSGTWWIVAGAPVWCVLGLTADTVWQRG